MPPMHYFTSFVEYLLVYVGIQNSEVLTQGNAPIFLGYGKGGTVEFAAG